MPAFPPAIAILSWTVCLVKLEGLPATSTVAERIVFASNESSAAFASPDSGKANLPVIASVIVLTTFAPRPVRPKADLVSFPANDPVVLLVSSALSLFIPKFSSKSLILAGLNSVLSLVATLYFLFEKG